MPATVRIPTVLRSSMEGLASVDADGATIGEVLAGLSLKYPAVSGQLLGQDGQLHRFLNVYVNDDDVRYLGGLAAPVADGDEVTLLPAVAGGGA
ncbi:MAG TPA: MoaD/ThiS family protein [Acidimicrobiales bacterium]|nr:MoaD/ThiS family protein [Acidimicrobiales bacterium]